MGFIKAKAHFLQGSCMYLDVVESDIRTIEVYNDSDLGSATLHRVLIALLHQHYNL